MKKRGLEPTAATYTTILDALSTNPTVKTAERVRSIHQGLLARNCMSTIHANALLKAYGKFQDMEAFRRLWEEMCEPLHEVTSGSRIPQTPSPGGLPFPDAQSFTCAITYFAEDAVRREDKHGLKEAWSAWSLASSLPSNVDGARWIDSGTVFSILHACNICDHLDPTAARNHVLAVEKACFPTDPDKGILPLDVPLDIRVVWQFMLAHRLKGDVAGALRLLGLIRAHGPSLTLDWPFWAGVSGMVRDNLPPWGNRQR